MGLSHRAPTHKLTTAQTCSQGSGSGPGRPPAGVTVTATAAATAGSALFVTRPRPLPAHTPRGNGCQERRRLRQKGAAGTLRRRRQQQQVWAHRPPSSGTGGFGTGASPGQVAAKAPFGLHHHLPGWWGAGGVPVTGGGRAQQVVAGARGGGGSMGAGGKGREGEEAGTHTAPSAMVVSWPSLALLPSAAPPLTLAVLHTTTSACRCDGGQREGAWMGEGLAGCALTSLTPGASTDTWPDRPLHVPTPYTALPSSTTASPPHPHTHHTRKAAYRTHVLTGPGVEV
ncbi:hypothetical protein Pmani_005725 [Petrolisthes manimaculis]|uniref:Uncharacterized protein n=1 Tax=Petrolisthes manimaculis TaxID=1843537 RepID=A0AAE1UH70_9EUCA|nr:hypothetical protein Pmani_005725 [Petrolisthes manimaculis]